MKPPPLFQPSQYNPTQSKKHPGPPIDYLAERAKQKASKDAAEAEQEAGKQKAGSNPNGRQSHLSILYRLTLLVAGLTASERLRQVIAEKEPNKPVHGKKIVELGSSSSAPEEKVQESLRTAQKAKGKQVVDLTLDSSPINEPKKDYTMNSKGKGKAKNILDLDDISSDDEGEPTI